MDSRVILFVLIILGYFLIGKKSRKGYIIFLCVLLCLEGGLRHIAVGRDTYSYFIHFLSSQNLSWSDILQQFKLAYLEGEAKDPGYLIVEKLFLSVSDDWQLFLFVLSSFFFYALGSFIYNNTRNSLQVLFAFVLYVALLHISILCVLRQAICMAITFLITPLILKRNWFLFAIITILASTIHVSMLFVLFLYPISLMNFTAKKYLLLLAFFLVPVIALNANGIISYMASFIENEYYMSYAESEGRSGAMSYFVLCSLVALFVFFNIEMFNTSKKSLYVAGIIMLTLLAPLVIVHGTLIRLSQYFAFYMMFAIPIAFENKSVGLSPKFAYAIAITILIILTFNTSFSYYFFWEYVPSSLYMY